MSRIYISYRRADAAAYAGPVFDHLSNHFFGRVSEKDAPPAVLDRCIAHIHSGALGRGAGLRSEDLRGRSLWEKVASPAGLRTS
jgi:hypothetical protein